MPDYNWPDAEHRTLIGKRISRVDSPVKVSGRAKYTYDYHGTGPALWQGSALALRKSKDHQHRCERGREDAGVKAVEIIQKPGSTAAWAGDEVVARRGGRRIHRRRCHSPD